MARDDATEQQIRAADPTVSTWLSANAGSGKTRVLTDRVARLLLGGVPPQNILCLTYTKAAAAEMQNRLFRRLGEWAMKEDGALTEALDELGVADTGDLDRARRLFARAIETPGGLKIQTIHSFCAGLLRRFPLESGVSPQFTEMDERAARILQRDIVEEMADGADSALVTGLAQFYASEDFAALTQEIACNRAYFDRPADPAEIWGWFGLDPEFDESSLAGLCFDGGESALIAAAAPVLQSQSPTMVSLATALALVNPEEPGDEDREALFDAFLYRENGQYRPEAKKASVPTKKAQEALGGLLAPFQDFMDRVARARHAQMCLYSARKSLALHRFAGPFLTRYAAGKQRRGWLDFDDLIEKAAALLRDRDVSAWVLYKLEGTIDHVLVDEAQDTSPAQWQVIERLTQEFTVGEGARAGVARTIFAVGDPKQSIYSFQGADPAEFSRMRGEFARGLGRVGQGLQEMQLAHSFRSSPAVLGLVDHCLQTRPGLGDPFLHRARFPDKPGRVDLWPVIEAVKHEEERAWTDTTDRPTPESHVSRLATLVAEDIRVKLEGEILPRDDGTMRPVEPGDILVLVRRRSGGLFEGIIRACKERGLPIAGADRLRIGGELAVKDLTALLRFLATPEDDLSLAAVLRSPLFGWSEGELFALAHGRGKGVFLWRALSNAAERHEDTFSTLRALRDDADFLRPYDLIERILTRHRGRENLLARLGAEAEEGIDALLAQALAYERLEIPGLTGLLTWLEAEDVTIKRQVDAASNQIRVMTVHGAKGLESPIVYLPDTAKPQAPRPPELVRLATGGMAWRPPAAQTPDAVRAPLDAWRARNDEEWSRLLYVAMTRAGQWLIVGAAGDVGNERESWYRILEAGMEQAGAVTQDFGGSGHGSRVETGAWARPRGTKPEGQEAGRPDRPAWLDRTATVPPRPPAPLSPSDLGGAKALPGEAEADQEASLRRGRRIHRLLENLPAHPESDWPALGRALLSQGEDAAGEDEIAPLVTEATTLLTDPSLRFLFDAESLAEVDFSAILPGPDGRRVHGAIDRLCIDHTRILAVDFKTNAVVPDRPEQVPEGILRQMGAYRAALAAVYPGRRIETAILWTSVARLMPLPDDLTRAALSRLDDPPPCS